MARATLAQPRRRPVIVGPQDWSREQVTRLCKLVSVARVTPQGLRGTLATMRARLVRRRSRSPICSGTKPP